MTPFLRDSDSVTHPSFYSFQMYLDVIVTAVEGEVVTLRYGAIKHFCYVLWMSLLYVPFLLVFILHVIRISPRNLLYLPCHAIIVLTEAVNLYLGRLLRTNGFLLFDCSRHCKRSCTA